MEKKLWIWNWIGDGYNSCTASSRLEALESATAMARRTGLGLNESTLHEGSYRELAILDRRYASMFD